MVLGSKWAQVLGSLRPEVDEEWDFLKQAVSALNSTHQVKNSDRGLAMVEQAASVAFSPTRPTNASNAREFLARIPRDQHAHFDALSEALEVYESIHGHPLLPDQLNSQSLEELKKIRDLCLRRSLRPY